ncbi:cytochrome P450 [Colletotrichum scovillei]|uniref:Cytochrome P450 n=1 Tax=Colletotrichum scovillei TaxID=1209932 RepID=A0A9P7R6P3_9PEZI|nr:cytochrome P450 [Colletotrichum scovillei]KAF4782347.1 cytochrome P450 [Colletotrichum scovillei]KAG7049914.1 cytochrome P450 [Colletotrichum scovillei]KAG7068951.1 cytochrome P450 [Colletotrichum scovillei]KAG7072904.1 cytochrome P450 [Colletotrichum scovillei]
MSMSMLPNMNATAGAAVDGALFIEVAQRWPVAATALFACAVAYLLQTVWKSDPWADIPMVGTEFGGSEARRKQFMNGEARNLYLKGYRKFKERAFRITTARKSPNIVVAPKFMNELKRLPDDVLSFNRAIEESMHAKYTGIDTDIALLPHTVKTALTPALVRLNPIIADEVVEALRTELPQSCDWSEVKIMDKMMRVIAMASGRVFIGPELCRNEEYLDAAINYTLDLMKAVRKVADIAPWLRPFLAARTPEVKQVHHRIEEADKFLRPVVTARKEAEKSPDYQKPDDMLQWIMESQKKFGEKNDRELARYQLGISFAAIHTTTVTSTNALYTLAAMPELIPMLRDDIQQALAESNGVFTSGAMQNMKKLDSFLKETMRYYALGPTSFQRKVLKTFTLSNGQVIPGGSVIELPVIGINNDDEIFPDSEKFDALRFYKLRQAKTEQETGSKQAEVVANAQFVSVGQTSLTFGYGRHACPGRFFAVNEIKMIMATTLANYDIKNVGDSKERYKNLEFGAITQPDPNRKVLLRKL